MDLETTDNRNDLDLEPILGIRVSKCAKFLDCSETTVKELVDGGLLKSFTVSKSRGLRVTMDSVRQFVESGGVMSSSPLQGPVSTKVRIERNKADADRNKKWG